MPRSIKNYDFIVRDLKDLTLDLDDIILRNKVSRGIVQNASRQASIDLSLRLTIRRAIIKQEALRQEATALEPEIASMTDKLLLIHNLYGI